MDTPAPETKLMFLLTGGAPVAPLADARLHEALVEAGATRLQVNIDDEHTAEAMRIPHLEAPITALVSVWGEFGRDDVDRVAGTLAGVLGQAADSVHGYLVSERRPIAPTETWDGTRLDGLANMAVLRKPADLDHQEWLRRWHEDHTPIAIETQATFGYLQNTVIESVTTEAPPVDAIVEELFPIEGITDMHAFYGSGGDDEELSRRLTRLMASVARIGADKNLDLVPTSRYLYDLS